ncbi:MAG: preprotein translocase subunit SecG [Elusimicrobia bacterium CG08_land_8_20_14_0_20_44_26]|nr:MAG: preprotein translocase subunit SecG [Elusimicrobia bacterium CG08_land_8_20_14_0_20_44_26]
MYTFFVILHAIVAVLLIFIILLQVSRGSTGSAFLGGSSDSLLLGPAGDVFLKKVVVVLGIVFVVTSITISSLVKNRGVSFPDASPVAQPQPPPSE